MKTIYKYQLKENNSIIMPKDSKILSCQLQNDIITIWAFVDTDSHVIEKCFEIIGTGWPCNISGLDFIGTIQKQNGLVFHVFSLS